MICKNCGKEFEKYNERHIYCSDYCRVSAYQKKHTTTNDLTCKSCGKSFNGRVNTMYCSGKCKQAAYRARQNIFTIGTNGKKLPEFIEILKKNGIGTVLDVRKSATSPHVPEFSKNSLSVELPKIGIKYIHKEEFGVPYTIVKNYITDKSLTDMEFESFYREKVSNEIDTLAKEIKDYGKTVLLCACAYAVKQKKQKHNCHRSILVDILIENGNFKGVIHL
jgi:hypothetical protein